MDSVKQKSLEYNYEKILNVGFCLTPYEDLSDIIGSEPVVFGTTKDEKILSLEEVDALFKSQYEQMGDMTPGLDRKRIATHISPDGNNAFIVEEITLTLSSSKEINSIFMRASCVMEYNENQWKLTHWHTSTPVDTENDHWHLEEWQREKEKLQQLVDQQTADLHAKNRELEIEAAIERVRARTMAMHSSDELAEAASLLFQQMKTLGIETFSSGFTIWDQKKGELISWMCNADGSMNPPFRMPIEEEEWHKEQYESWLKGDKFIVKDLTGEQMKSYFRYLRSFPLLDEAFKKSESAGHPMPERQVHHVANFSHGNLLFITLKPVPDAHDIFKRFAKVFEQTYTRFLDLKKAEAQAREARIEMALERVRSRSMAMQKSDELNDVAFVLFEQLRNLGGEMWGTGFVFCEEDKDEDVAWFAVETGILPPVSIPNTDDPTHAQMYAGWKDNKDFISITKSGKELEDHYEYMLSLPKVRPFFQQILDSGLRFPKKQQWNAAYYKHGYLLLITTEEYSDPDTLKRFAKVFEQSYTRFEDLKKAEAQAREAKIEAALEKVRSRSMGMQSSEELPEVANLMFLEIQALGIHAWSCGYCILEEDRRSSICIMSSEGTIQKPFLLPHLGEPSFEEWDDFVHSDESFFVQELKEEEIESHYDFMKSLPQLKPIFQDLTDAGLSLPTYQINHLSKFSAGFLLFITYEEVPEAHDIFKRFTSVFDQTYTRFLDLQKSEQRAREAEIELSLERIRAQVTAMQRSSDLFDIVVNMRKEFISLGHKADYFWHMRWLHNSYEMSMTSEDGNRIGMVIRIPKFVHDAIPGLAEWEKTSDPVYIMPLNSDDAWDYIENMNNHGMYEQADPNAPTKKAIQQIGGLTFIIARTSHGEIGYSLPGEVPNPPQDALDTLKRFAGVFDLAYQRFEDLQESERQARLILEERDRLEKTLEELHATQDQLIQQEKLASLGQLTAGIAHEIKNPLNFVNNFSDLSVELIQEARNEIKLVETYHDTSLPEDALDELSAILDSVETNLQKIHEHGSRADGIVKSMLEHSRGGSGKMEPSDLNELVKEFTHLSFHGMRASKNPINVDIKFDLDDSIGLVPLVTEDFSRVIVNLCNNAFDAMREKLNSEFRIQNSEEYIPKLMVFTRKSESSAIIEIKDNGPGIPEEIKDKIMQPFFTTKKGTEGTGLGLSITNDIIKAHGGKLEVSSTESEGTTFTINLFHSE